MWLNKPKLIILKSLKMKKIAILGAFLLFMYTASSQNYYMTNPEGFGAAAIGGGTPTLSNTVTVDTYAKLKTALTSTTTANSVILVSGTIDCVYTSVLLNNKTIIGLPGAKLVNNIQTAAGSGILYIKPNSKNVIIRNLIFEGPGAWDVDGRDNLTNEGTDIWIDHCEFQDGMDGNFDNKGECDNTTISWCKFTYLKAPKTTGYVSGGTADHRFSNLVGSSGTDFPATDGHYSITFQNCYWAEGCKGRMPRARNAELHLLNCYFNVVNPGTSTILSSSLAIGLGGGSKNTTCYVENTDFAKVAKVYDITSYSGDGGTIGLAFTGCLNRADLTAGTPVTKPTYTYTALPVVDVATYIPDATCGAGATLSVTASGVISACNNLSIEDHALQGAKIYPTMVDTNLIVDLSESISGAAIINIYSLIGEKVFSYSKNVIPAEKLSLNLSKLSKGMYLCNLKIGDVSSTWKFMRK